jgi:cobaltochelatase CobN
VIWYITNVDTEILALRSALEALPADFPPVRAAQPWTFTVDRDLDGASCVLVRLLRGRRAWEPDFDRLRERCVERGIPLLAFAGEAVPDAELTRLSTVPSATITEAFRYLVNGGPQNLEQLLRFVADAVLRGGFGFDPPVEIPSHGLWRATPRTAGRPLVGVVFYRAHLVAGNTQFVDDLCDALEVRGADVMAVWCYSLRGEAAEPVLDLLRGAGLDVLITTVLATGGAAAGAGVAGAPGGLDGDEWDATALAALDVPIVQAPSAGRSVAEWLDDPGGLGPYDATAGIAIPEFDGRVIGPVFSFNEVVDDGDDLGNVVRAYRTVPDRVARLAGLAVRYARLRRTPVGQRRVAIVLSAYPTKRSRLGNAVGLDTPASAMRLLDAMAIEGYAITGRPAGGDDLMAALADGLTY